MISFNQKGDFKKLDSYFNKVKEIIKLGDLDKYGREGVAALSLHTPIDTGELASSWYYTIQRSKDRTEIVFCNKDVENGVPIAIILQYGHRTGNGGWVEGLDYINPALKPIFDKIVNNAWKEVTTL